jgi:hypothetical protein
VKSDPGKHGECEALDFNFFASIFFEEGDDLGAIVIGVEEDGREENNDEQERADNSEEPESEFTTEGHEGLRISNFCRSGIDKEENGIDCPGASNLKDLGGMNQRALNE